MIKDSKFTLLDCSLRDGGYYNKWNFSSELLLTYLDSCKNAGIKFVELGFKSFPKDGFWGPFYYTTDDYLEQFDLPSDITYAVMLNVSDLSSSNLTASQYVNSLFPKKSDSKISLVRVAVNFNHFADSFDILRILKSLGYRVALNLMQSQGKHHEKYLNAINEIRELGIVDVLYFADSLGSMNPKEVTSIVDCFKEAWAGAIGFHAHNNKGLALTNSLAALEAGVEWCDSTMMGMGRGAGNLPTESILLELENYYPAEAGVQALSPTLADFRGLMERYRWGPNEFYHYAANKNIHPTYVQSLLSSLRYKGSNYFSILESISHSSASSFSEQNLYNAANTSMGITAEGSWNPSGWLDKKDVLLIGSGSSIEEHLNAVLSYISVQKPFVVSLNVNRILPTECIDAVVISHPQRVMLDFEDYQSLECPIIMSKDMLNLEIGDRLKQLDIMDYGLNVVEDSFIICEKECTVPSPLALSYALCILTQAGAEEIRLIGFDGYGSEDPRQNEVTQAFTKYQSLPEAVSLEALTPTNYPIRQGSLYSPRINSKDYLVVIPARYNSTRFPGKPLADLCGKSLVQHVWGKCVEAVGEENVLVATDDVRIMEHCNQNQMNVMMTSSECLTGTDRLAEVAVKFKRKFYINVQGDEPLINPQDIIKFIKASTRDTNSIFNGFCAIENEDDFLSPNVPKVVVGVDNTLLYISRAPIPANKSRSFTTADRQVCIYSFPRESLLKFGRFNKKSLNENIEDIEILRFIDNGYRVKMIRVSDAQIAVDTESDLKRASSLLKVIR